ncbi:hypothetical protein EKO04_008341 [Ascochyta lentis]|uniref:Uncharacterized protein n=1 Tax=Ascochyta lentis TaxID=205686 RepID=A0A8H7MHJ6_9PLEO|nr:hypothetical protein EKO04_008341 [Ascochyta lentis]
MQHGNGCSREGRACQDNGKALFSGSRLVAPFHAALSTAYAQAGMSKKACQDTGPRNLWRRAAPTAPAPAPPRCIAAVTLALCLSPVSVLPWGCVRQLVLDWTAFPAAAATVTAPATAPATATATAPATATAVVAATMRERSCPSSAPSTGPPQSLPPKRPCSPCCVPACSCSTTTNTTTTTTTTPPPRHPAAAIVALQ